MVFNQHSHQFETVLYRRDMERLDKHFEKLTKASFARYGFAYGDLMARWPEIVGETLAQHCEPERIKWPRGAGETAQKLGGTLVIRAEPGRGLDLQYQSHQIIERINQFYGYVAVTSVKIMQGHVTHTKSLKNKENSLDLETEKALETSLESIADEKLKQALHRLGAGALANRPGSPHNK
jgi:hypothetical protein